MKAPKTIELSYEEFDALVQRVEMGTLKDGDIEIIKGMIETIKFLSGALQEKNISIKRLRSIIFGAKTEKTKVVVVTSHINLSDFPTLNWTPHYFSFPVPEAPS